MKQPLTIVRQNRYPEYDRVIDVAGIMSILFVPGEGGSLVLQTGFAHLGVPVMIRQMSSWILHFPDIGRGQHGGCSPGQNGQQAETLQPDGTEVLHNGSPARDGVIVEDGDFLQIGKFPFYFRDNRLWTENREELQIAGLSYENLPDQGTYPAFRRNTRILSPVDETPVEILNPSELPRQQEERLALRLLPSLGMLAAAGFMASRGGTAMLLFSGISAATGFFTAVAGVISGNRQYRRALNKRTLVYSRYIDEKRKEIEQARIKEAKLRRQHYPEPEEMLTLLRRFSPDLFERSLEDADFLHLRLGTGTVAAGKIIRYRNCEQLEEKDELQLLPEKTAKKYKWLQDVPVVCDLKETTVIGVTGRESDRYSFLKNLVLDIALHQYHSDVRMIAVAEQEHAHRLHCLRLFPHFRRDYAIFPGIALDKESMADVLESLYRELSYRKEKRIFESHILVFLYDDAAFREHPVSRFLTMGKELGVSFLFFADKRADLMPGCRQIIEIQKNGYAVITDAEDDRNQTFFTFPSVSDNREEEAATLLAPVYTQEVSLNHDLTREVSFYSMLGIERAEELDLERMWKKASPERSLAVPVGITATGILCLDIRDAAYGPHGLVAGTTGSGKSELLQTYILSMAVSFPPDEVAFVIIDYKGGGLASPFFALPHLLGTITNMDGRGALRAMRSVKGELLKRQMLFQTAKVNHIDLYMQLYKKGCVDTPLPHLVIIIDEFAELKAAHPEFMKELVSAARIGRSLGVHLILATQKPSGQVSDQIWSNSRFRICLKVQDASDSNEVLKSPLAAEIREPGRAYLQVGNQEVFELFQSAYSSGPAASVPESQRGFLICEISDSGKRIPVYQRKEEKSSTGITQMQAVVHHIADYCKKRHIRKLPDIFTPALRTVIPYSFHPEGKTRGFRADIGWYDDPDHQRQCIYSLDFSRQHLLVTGSSRSGKTVLLETLIRDLAGQYNPKELQIYVIDCASRLLKRLEGLPHVGGVVLPAEQEKMASLFRMLKKETEKRKAVLESSGADSLEAARAEGITSLPDILLVIDHLTAFKELFLQEMDVLVSLCSEGLSAGFHVAAVSPQASAVGYRYLTLFGERIALFCSDAGEYRYLYDHLGELPEEIPGRCIVEQNGNFFSCQIYQSFEGETSEEKALNIRQFVQNMKHRYPSGAKPVPMIPELLTYRQMEICLKEEYEARFQVNGSIGAADMEIGIKTEFLHCFQLPLGLDRQEITPVFLDLASAGVVYLSGKRGFGKHNWMRWMVYFLQQRCDGRCRFYVADGINRRLRWMKERTDVETYSVDPEKTAGMLSAISAQLKQRHFEAYGDETGNHPDMWDYLVLLLDCADALEEIGRNPEALENWNDITGKYKQFHVCIVMLCIENEPVSYHAPEPLQKLRERRNCLFFDDLKNCRLFEIPYSQTKKASGTCGPGDAWFINGNECIQIRTPWMEEWPFPPWALEKPEK